MPRFPLCAKNTAALFQFPVLALLAVGCQSAPEADPGTEQALREAKASGVYRELDGIRFLRLQGTHHDIGYEYGRILRKDLWSVAAHVRELEKSIVDELPWYASPFAGVFKFFKTRAIPDRLPPEYVDEVRGMSEGSGLPYRELLFFAGGAGLLGCASVVARTPTGIIHGRNFDFYPYFLGNFPVVLDYQAPGRNRVVSFGIVGNPGLFTGVNEKGVSVTLNISSTRDPEAKGILTQFKLRRALETSSNLAEVDQALRAQPNDEQGWMMTFASRNDDSGVIYDAISHELRKTALESRPQINTFNSIFAESRFPDGAGLRRKWLKFSMTSDDYDMNRESLARHFLSRKKLDGVPSMLDFLGQQGLREPGDFPEHGINNDMTMQTFVFEPRENKVYFAAAQAFSAKAPMVSYDVGTGKVTHYRDASPDFVSGNLRAIIDAEPAFYRLWQRKAPRAEFAAEMTRPGWLQIPALGQLMSYYREDRQRIAGDLLLKAIASEAERYPGHAPLWHWKAELLQERDPAGALKAWETALACRTITPMTRVTVLSALSEFHAERKEKAQAKARAEELLTILDEASKRLVLSPWLQKMAEKMRLRAEEKE